MSVAGLGYAASSGGCSTGMLTGDKPQVGHELFGRVKAGQVAKLGN
jgi:hypothetical protein